eukprot:1978824-Prymnesium_polylepis.1
MSVATCGKANELCGPVCGVRTLDMRTRGMHDSTVAPRTRYSGSSIWPTRPRMSEPNTNTRREFKITIRFPTSLVGVLLVKGFGNPAAF